MVERVPYRQKGLLCRLLESKKVVRNFIIVLSLTTTLFTSTQLTFAQTGGFNGNGGEVICRNGSRDWDYFISSVISYNGFVEYWKDILVRYNANMCQYLDIDNLIRRLDKTREQIRKAFYVCDASAPKLAVTYHQLEAELYFLRKYIAVTNGNILFKSKDQLQNDFLDQFTVEQPYFTQEAGQTLFDQLMSKYTSRQNVYLNCSDPTWGNLIQKWNEFKTNIGGFTSLSDASESINKEWDDVVNTPFMRTGGLLGGLLDIKINGLDPATALGDIAAELQKNSPNGFTFQQLGSATSADLKKYDDAVSRIEYLTQYQQQYQNTSATITKQILDRVDTLDETINTTYKFIDKTASCAKGVIGKVCS